MFLFIIGILVLLVAIGLTIFAITEKKIKLIAASAAAGVFAVVLIVCSCLSTVPTGHTGILITFGKVEDLSLPNGVNVHAPWQNVITMSNKEQKDSGMGLAFSKDIQEVSYSYTIQHMLQPGSAPTLYKNVGTDYFDIVISPAINAIIKTYIGKANAESLIINREAITTDVNREAALIGERYGLSLTVIIDNFDFTDVFTNAVEAKQVAEQEKLRAQTEQEKLTMEAEQKAARDKIEAEAAAAIAKINAEADLEVQKINADAAEYAGQKEAAVNQAIAASLTPELVAYYEIMQWNGQLPTTYMGDGEGIPVLDVTE
ncbi:MAG: prohibitin family protein [Clostridiales bacterium]|nr:prohibitin family protein [Clostridiales bacterium]